MPLPKDFFALTFSELEKKLEPPPKISFTERIKSVFLTLGHFALLLVAMVASCIALGFLVTLIW